MRHEVPKPSHMKYGWHIDCGGSVDGVHTNGVIGVGCSRCPARGFASLVGKVEAHGDVIDIIQRATLHWIDNHGGCSGEIFFHEFTPHGASTPTQIRRVLRCRTHGSEFRIEIAS